MWRMSEGREQIPLLWSTGGETALAKGFCFNMEWGGGGGYSCVRRRTKLSGRNVNSEKVRETDRR